MPEQKPASTAIQPYLFFGGRCEEAIAFYQETLDAKVDMVMRFSDSPEPPPAGMLPPGFENKIMHSAFRIRGTTLMASDGCEEGGSFQGFSLTLTVSTEAEAHRVFEGLADGGRVQMPLAKTFWSPCYGMLVDRFGINWMVMVPAELA